jgi:hypothetical protein
MKRMLVFFLLTLLVVVPVFGQSGTQTIRLTGLYSIDVPASWKQIGLTEYGVLLDTGKSEIAIDVYDLLRQRGEYGDILVDARDFLEHIVTEKFDARSFDSTSVERDTFDIKTGASYTFQDLDQGRQFERQVTVADDFFALIVASIAPLEGDTIDEGDLASLDRILVDVSQADRYSFVDGASFDLTIGSWILWHEAGTGTPNITITDGDVFIDIVYWPRYAAFAGFEDPDERLSGFWFHNKRSEYGSFDPSAVEEGRIAGYDALSYNIRSELLNGIGFYGREYIQFVLPTNQSYVTAEVMTREMDYDYNEALAVLDTFQAGNRVVCPLFADPGINIRALPTTGSDIVRQTDDERPIAVSDTIGEDGYRWFNVREGWIRSDIIFFEINACEGLPRETAVR